MVVAVAAAAVVLDAASEQKLVRSNMRQFELGTEELWDDGCESSSHFEFEARCMKATQSAPRSMHAAAHSAAVSTLMSGPNRVLVSALL